MVSGDVICAIAMTEPQAGSDLRGIRTRARRDGNHWVISGQKVYISNGQLADLIVVAAKTDPDDSGGGISLFLVEADRDGFARGSNLKKLGMKAQDTSELFFEDVRVPATNMLGAEGQGMGYLTSNLARERLVQAVRSAAAVEAILEWTVDYTSDREAFGRAIGGFQNTQFKLAEVKTEAVALRCFVDRCIELYLAGELGPVEAAMAKLKGAEVQGWAVDQCLQFFGGAGYMWEYPIARAYADARVVRIAGGATEVMKLIIGRDMFRDRLKKKA
jgi:alkylation response protein AidB-like acyl-CoA dehydrogenase